MDLRKELLPIVTMVEEGKIEEFFKRKLVAAKYDEVMHSKKVKGALNDFFNEIEKNVKVVKQGMSEKDIRQLENATSTEVLMSSIRLTIMTNSIGIATRRIIFEGAPIENAVADVITDSLVLEILNAFSERIIEELLKSAIIYNIMA